MKLFVNAALLSVNLFDDRLLYLFSNADKCSVSFWLCFFNKLISYRYLFSRSFC